MREFTDPELNDLVDVARGVGDTDLARLDPSDFAPESTRSLSQEIRRDLLSGRGFALLRGFPVAELEPRTTAAAFLILGGLVGRPRSQNAAGHLLGHVKDVGADLANSGSRIYQTHERQSFHTDSTDAVALLCLKTAASGGRSMLASVEAVYRVVYERQPDLAARLFDPVATDRRDEQPPGEKPWFEIPVLSWYDNYLTVLYQRTYIDSAARFDDAPRSDAQQIAALDLFDEVLNDPAIYLSMQLEPGDMQFVHNHSLLHDRTAFVDHSDPAKRRHLLRLWLSLPGDRRLPHVFTQRYGSVAVGNRGGIVVAGTELCAPLDVLLS
jgi:alpha-ketoglutarate-dependent taurine dioxygenase